MSVCLAACQDTRMASVSRTNNTKVVPERRREARGGRALLEAQRRLPADTAAGYAQPASVAFPNVSNALKCGERALAASSKRAPNA